MSITFSLTLTSVWVYLLIAIIAQRRGFTAEIPSAIALMLAFIILTNGLAMWDTLTPPDASTPFFGGPIQPMPGGYFVPASGFNYWRTL